MSVIFITLLFSTLSLDNINTSLDLFNETSADEGHDVKQVLDFADEDENIQKKRRMIGSKDLLTQDKRGKN